MLEKRTKNQPSLPSQNNLSLLNVLPQEIILVIFQMLPLQDFIRFSHTERALHGLSSDAVLWRTFLHQYFPGTPIDPKINPKDQFHSLSLAIPRPKLKKFKPLISLITDNHPSAYSKLQEIINQSTLEELEEFLKNLIPWAREQKHQRFLDLIFQRVQVLLSTKEHIKKRSILLHWAVQCNAIKWLENIDEKKPFYNSILKHIYENYTPIELACSLGLPEIVAILFRKGASLDLGLHLAAWEGKIDVIHILHSLIKDPDLWKTLINRRFNFQYACSPLLEAVKNNQKAAVETLLLLGANINSRATEKNPQNNLGKTALHIAASYGYHELIPCLLNANPELLNTYARHIDPINKEVLYTPVETAILYHKYNVLEILLDYTPNLLFCDPTRLSSVHAFFFHQELFKKMHCEWYMQKALYNFHKPTPNLSPGRFFRTANRYQSFKDLEDAQRKDAKHFTKKLCGHILDADPIKAQAFCDWLYDVYQDKQKLIKILTSDEVAALTLTSEEKAKFDTFRCDLCFLIGSDILQGNIKSLKMSTTDHAKRYFEYAKAFAKTLDAAYLDEKITNLIVRCEIPLNEEQMEMLLSLSYQIKEETEQNHLRPMQ